MWGEDDQPVWPQETLLEARWSESPSSENLNWYFLAKHNWLLRGSIWMLALIKTSLTGLFQTLTNDLNPKETSRILLNFLLPWFHGYSSIVELWNRNMWWADSQKWEEIRKKVSLRIVSIRLPDKLIHSKRNLFSLSAKFLVENAEYIQSPLCLVTALLIFSQLCSIIR